MVKDVVENASETDIIADFSVPVRENKRTGQKHFNVPTKDLKKLTTDKTYRVIVKEGEQL